MGSACSCGEGEKLEVLEPEPVPLAAEELEAPALVSVDGAAKLTVAIVSARGLRNADRMPGTGKSDCYCILKTGGKQVHKTKVILDSLEPIWREEVELAEYADNDPLEFRILDEDVGSSDYLGKVIMQSELFAEKGFNGELQIQEAGKGNTQAYLRVKVKKAGMEKYPEGPPNEFSLTLERPSLTVSFGIDVDTQDKATLFVTELRPGPTKEYNERVGPEEQLKIMDFIVEVNGTGGSSKEMLTVFKEAMKVELVVRRPLEVLANIDRPDASEPLGLKFHDTPPGNFLPIFEITEGVVQTWNDVVGPSEGVQLKPGDRIISVGGQPGPAGVLRKKLSKAGTLQLALVRPAPAE